MKISILRLASALLLSATLQDGIAGDLTPMRVFFVPFQFETYVPITRETIECDADEMWTFSNELQGVRVTESFQIDPSVRFDEKRVRAKIITPTSVSFVDAQGVVSDGGELKRLDTSRFRTLLDSLGGQHRTLTKTKSSSC